jgi:type II secretory pathway pseudopilin PulG
MIRRTLRDPKGRQSGLSIVEVLVGLGLLSLLGLGMSTLMTNSMSSQRSIELRSDVESLRQFIQSNLSCTQTFASFPTRPVNCTGAIALRRESGQVIVNAAGQQFGDWTLQASCETIAGQAGLSIYATRPRPGGGFFEDPLTRRPFDTSHPASAFYAPAARPCGTFFVAAGSPCPAGQALLAWAGTAPICMPAACPAGQAEITRIGNVPICAASPCPAGQAEITRIGNAPVCGPSTCAPGLREVSRVGGVPTCVNTSTPRSPLIVQNSTTASGPAFPKDLSVSCPSGTVLRSCFGYMNNCPQALLCNYLGAFASGNTCTARFDPDDAGGSHLYVQAVCGYID